MARKRTIEASATTPMTVTEESLARLAASGVDAALFSRTLTDWQKTHGRQHLAWQVTDPYRRCLSEIMLQQTQVAVVEDYFTRFVRRFPTLEDLAKADEDAVMELWQGLGYYRRARHLHAAARKIVDDFGGVFPTTPEALAELPGVGLSTANAIASFCFGVCAPVVDGNVMRLLARVLNLPFAVDDTQGTKALWHAARFLMQTDEPGVYNQAVMDLGATVCTRTSPACDACPLRAMCAACAAGTALERPVKRVRRAKRARTMVLALLTDGERTLFVRRGETDIWPALWCLPEIEESLAAAHFHTVAQFTHELTHIKLTVRVVVPNKPDFMRAFCKKPDAPEKGPEGAPRRWVLVGERAQLALPAPVRRTLEELEAGLFKRV